METRNQRRRRGSLVGPQRHSEAESTPAVVAPPASPRKHDTKCFMCLDTTRADSVECPRCTAFAHRGCLVKAAVHQAYDEDRFPYGRVGFHCYNNHDMDPGSSAQIHDIKNAKTVILQWNTWLFVKEVLTTILALALVGLTNLYLDPMYYLAVIVPLIVLNARYFHVGEMRVNDYGSRRSRTDLQDKFLLVGLYLLFTGVLAWMNGLAWAATVFVFWGVVVGGTSPNDPIGLAVVPIICMMVGPYLPLEWNFSTYLPLFKYWPWVTMSIAMGFIGDHFIQRLYQVHLFRELKVKWDLVVHP